MRIHIRHRTVYRYAEPVVHGVQYLRLTPRSSTAQSVDHWHVDAPGRVTPWTDHFGNLCHTLAVDRVADAISVVVSGAVETFDTHGVMPASNIICVSMSGIRWKESKNAKEYANARIIRIMEDISADSSNILGKSLIFTIPPSY